MEKTTPQPTAPGTSQDVARATAAAVGQHVRGRLLGVIAVTSLALLTILSATFSSGGLLGGRTLTVVTAMLVLGGAFVILRAAISHDECSRRVDGLCRELESSNTRLKEFSFTDDVTGLYNRRFFATRLEDEVSRYSRFNQPLSVVMLDIDGFKAVNDELGHAAGDETLRIVGHILQTAVAQHRRGLPVRWRRVRGPARGDRQGRRAAVRRAGPPADRGRGLRPRPDDHGEPRSGLPPRGRRTRARRTSSPPRTGRSTRPSARARTRSRDGTVPSPSGGAGAEAGTCERGRRTAQRPDRRRRALDPRASGRRVHCRRLPVPARDQWQGGDRGVPGGASGPLRHGHQDAGARRDGVPEAGPHPRS